MRTHQGGQFWLPAAIWALFAIVQGFFSDSIRSVEVASSYLGVVLPLLGGILGAYAILDDPILELQFASPRSSIQMIVERVSIIFGVLTICAITYQVLISFLHVDLTPYGPLWFRQFAWIVPSLALTGMGVFCAFAFAQATSGAMLIGMVWIVQLVAREWFLQNSIMRYCFLFTGALYPKVEFLIPNYIALFILGIVFFTAAWLLLKKQERFI
jgi:hypothetical protein